MKSFIERIFKVRREKQDVKQAETVKSEINKPIEQIKKVEIQHSKPKHIDCNCFKCVRWRQQNAK